MSDKKEVTTENFIGKNATQQEVQGGSNVEKLSNAVPLDRMIKQVENEPDTKYLWSGIKENTFGFIYGPSKSGKTTLCENLGLSITAGVNEFLGKPIEAENRRVLFVSFEEHYKERTLRNIKQIEHLKHQIGEDTSWVSNYSVVGEDMPRYLMSGDDWQELRQVIIDSGAGTVFIDSLSRMHSASIEDSRTAQDVIKKLRTITEDLNLTVIVIHHTHKMGNERMSIHSLAGSRMLAQEADFIIGVNKTSSNNRYIKEVAFRHKQENEDSVYQFSISENNWINISGEVSEDSLMVETDGRTDAGNKRLVVDYIGDFCESHSRPISAAELFEAFVTDSTMSKPTLYKSLNDLTKEGIINKPSKGMYMPKQP